MGRTCGIVCGCVFVPVGNGPVICFLYMFHTYFHYKTPDTFFTAVLRFGSWADGLVRGWVQRVV